MSIPHHIARLKSILPASVTLVAVSKFHPAEAVWEAYNAGQRVFGESRAQELKEKRKKLPADIEWHFIGPLQSNKVKDIAPFIHTIQSVDSLKLLKEIEKQAAKQGRVIRVLLEIHIASEEEKHGFSPDECRRILEVLPPEEFTHIRIGGLMGMATYTDDTAMIASEFRQLHRLFVDLKNTVCKENPDFQELSMGMSQDYQIAVREGSTMVRIGTDIFGEREY